jgi:hypothetical protein
LAKPITLAVEPCAKEFGVRLARETEHDLPRYRPCARYFPVRKTTRLCRSPVQFCSLLAVSSPMVQSRPPVRAVPISTIADTEAFAFPKIEPAHKRRRPRSFWTVKM